MSIRRLNDMLFGAKTEKTAAVVGDSDHVQTGAGRGDAEDGERPTEESDEADETPAQEGHGRNGADAYRGAERIEIAHPSLFAGDACPECGTGTVYEKSPGVVVRVTGQAPLSAKRYELQKLRCHLCGKVFTAELAEAAGTRKYDAKAASMIALLKYGSGLPFNRLEGLQRNLEIPLPASTQWDIVSAFTPGIEPAFEELIRQAAQGDVLHNDDTTVKILELMGNHARQVEDASAASRRGLFTSGVVATREAVEWRCSSADAGTRARTWRRCSSSAPRSSTLRSKCAMRCRATCRASWRRSSPTAWRMLGVSSWKSTIDFPPECRYVLEALKVVYHNDHLARHEGHSAEQRLRFHQVQSGPTMHELHHWLQQQFEEKLVEPNSALGGSIDYMLRHWERLTLFLRQPGAPLDNNLCERALKKAILHRKNALFFKTENGARVGDRYMSLIHTCELNQANPFDYLTELLSHAAEAAANPGVLDALELPRKPLKPRRLGRRTHQTRCGPSAEAIELHQSHAAPVSVNGRCLLLMLRRSDCRIERSLKIPLTSEERTLWSRYGYPFRKGIERAR